MFIRRTSNAIIPQYQTALASGMDLYSIETISIPAGSRAMISTGLSIKLPADMEAQIRSRSGLAAKHGVFVLNSPGTVDADYTGELKIILQNSGDQVFHVNSGDRIAQLVLSKIYRAEQYVKNVIRNDGGFGSTGA